MKTLILIFLLIAVNTAFSYNYFEDTVWTKRTDQLGGFWKVKFSNNDSIIVAHGVGLDLFFDAETGNEIMRIPGNDEVFFFDNDRKFLRINNDKKIFEIFDLSTFEITDSLNSDGFALINSPFGDITKDQKVFISQIDRGFCLWDLDTKQIINHKSYPEEPGQVSLSLTQVKFICNDTKIICKMGKVYEDPEHPGNPDYYKTESYFIIYDSNTLDSVGQMGYARSSRVTNNCKYIALATGDPDYGVQIWDFEKREFLHHIPVNGPSLTGMEFSPDDKYLVTSNSINKDYGMYVWDIETGENLKIYKDGGYQSISISNSGKYIISSVGKHLFYYPFLIQSDIPNKEASDFLIIPNPTSGHTELIYEQEIPDIITISLSDMEGQMLKPLYSEFMQQGKHEIDIDLNDQSPGVYFINIKTSHYTKSFKIVVER